MPAGSRSPIMPKNGSAEMTTNSQPERDEMSSLSVGSAQSNVMRLQSRVAMVTSPTSGNDALTGKVM